MSELESMRNKLLELNEENRCLLETISRNNNARDKILVDIFMQENHVDIGTEVHFKAYDSLIPANIQKIWVENGIVYFEVMPGADSMRMFGSLFKRKFRAENFSKMFEV